MAYKRLIDKFASAYPILGVYLHDSGRIITLNQNPNPKGIIVLRENMNKLIREGTHQIDYQSEKLGLIINDTNTKSQIIIITPADRMDALSKHWKRIRPAVLKSLPVEEIVEEESPLTQMARMASKINELFDEMINNYTD